MARFRSRRLAAGVEVLGDGALPPWHVRRPDGWVLSAARVPLSMPGGEPGWLLDALGVEWSSR